MRTVLCFGDSNTWGFDPETDGRRPWEQRWPGCLQRLLGLGYRVVEEGLNGRTACWEDPLSHGRNGRAMLGPLLESHFPVDMLVLMLGTNEMKSRFGLTAHDVARGVQTLVQDAWQSEFPPRRILWICPPRLVVIRAAWAAEFQKAGEKSARLAQCCEPLAREAGALFLNAGLVVSGDQLDGVHLTEAEHEALARAVAEKVLGEPGPGDEGPEGI
jgi:lysophospholipase L1-like esterase